MCWTFRVSAMLAKSCVLTQLNSVYTSTTYFSVQGFKAVKLYTVVFCIGTLCSLVGGYQRFGATFSGALSLHILSDTHCY